MALCFSAVRALLLLLLPLSALADPPGKAEFDEAKRLFDAGRSSKALPLFEKAVELSNRRASTILALALCERELEMYEQALKHLDEYLEVVPAERDNYREMRAELEAKVSTIEVKPPPPPPPPPIEASPPPPAIVTPPAPVEEDGSGPSALKVTLLSAGGAAVVTGVVFAVLAARAEADVKSRVEEGVGPARAVEDRAAEGFRFAVTADVLLIAGVVAGGVGLFVD
jgi:tetratricopeptide (TPR) repeat protein